MRINKNVVLGFLVALLSVLFVSSLAFGKILVTNNSNYAEDAAFYKTVANEMVRQGDVDEAIANYEKVLEFGEDYNVRNNLAVLYYNSGKYSGAISHLRVLIETEPSNPAYHYDLAVNLVDKFRNTDEKNIQDLHEALAEYLTAENLKPGFENAANNVAVLKTVLSNEQ